MQVLTRALATALVLCVAAFPTFSVADEVFIDDFSKEAPGRWESVSGEWNVKDGAMIHAHSDDASHDMAVAAFPFTEGMIEVKGIALKENKYKFGSVGIAIKYFAKDDVIYFRFGSYGTKNVDGHAAPPAEFKKVMLGSGKPELGRKYDLTVIVRNGLIGLCIDDVMVGVCRDPYAGKPGRPGLFSESEARFDDFKVTRWK